MTRKNPIAVHKNKDLVELREMLLMIARDDTATKKDRIEASKLMLRAHHALAPEKVTEVKSDIKFHTLEKPTLKPEAQDKLQALLDACHSSQ